MTRPLVSPSKFHGLPWETWTNALGPTSPTEDKPPETKQSERNKAGVMKLPKEDMKIFGLCPERDLFTVVVCETCNMVVKPQALLDHFEMRHSNNDILPTQPTVGEVAVQQQPTTAKVVKTIAKNPPAKVKTKKTPNKEISKSKDGVVSGAPSLPVSLTLETPIPDPTTSKGETLQPVVALTPLSSGGTAVVPVVSKSTASSSASTIAVRSKPRRPPRKHAPIKKREYDPDKHCGVITAETMKPCTWSLTCKSHPMSLRRAVTGRSKPFDQLLVDHRQAKEALLKQKRNLENSSVMLTPPSSSSSSGSEQKIQPSEKLCVVVESVTTLLLRLPELSLDVTPAKRIYLSSSPQDLVINSVERPTLPLTTTPAPTPTSTAPTHTQLDVVAFTLNHPRALNVNPMFSSHKIGGLVYTNRRMQIARQGLESCLHRAGNGI
ncbi:ataxin-7-like protein 1 isoform X2 [Homalodisca vitripennis]|uniref:ataxin-7-like protein 1 isoform X2 n=1 Tax=Homalodisca vitripennis TaxID=197043 RepID=UPI001EE9B47F|nr:ataxin-7-like protein 1 isoform X2 [Homalodisca vitripennis]